MSCFKKDVLTLFEAHFTVDEPSWMQVDHLFSNRFCTCTKHEDVSGEIALLHNTQFKKENIKYKEAFEKLVDKLSKLISPTFLLHINKVVLKKLIKQAVGATD